MKLLFVRHGTASSRATWEQDDDLRPLTRAGRQRFSAACEALVGARALHPDLIVTSPLVRARETAELLNNALDQSVRLVEDTRLGHDFDVAALSAILAEHPEALSVAIVGHNPSFAEVLSAVTGGANLDVRKGAVALVDIDDPVEPSGRLLWLAPPSLFGRDATR